MISVAWADTINGSAVTAVTVFDKHGNGDTTGNSWYGNQEYREVETPPNAATGNTWDFRGMWFDASAKKLYVVAGFDLSLGAHYAGQTNYLPMGDLFVRTGAANPFLTLDGIGGSAPNSTYTVDGKGYTYAIVGGTAYLLKTTSTLLQANAASSVGDANPFLLKYLNETQVATGLVTYGSVAAGSSGTDTITNVAHALGGDFYAAYNLAWMGADLGDSFFHLSYACGNDGVNGFIPSGSVPIPPSVLLLGSGLVGLAYARRRRLLG